MSYPQLKELFKEYTNTVEEKDSGGLLYGIFKKPTVSEEDVDPKELAIGVEIELEHTNDRKIATIIALHHLAEIKDYYTRLKKMESEGKTQDVEEDGRFASI